MVVLLIAVWFVIFAGLLAGDRPARAAALGAYTATAVALVLITETLSVFRAITLPWLVVAWILVLAGSTVVLRGRFASGLSRLLTIWRTRDLRAWDWAALGVVGAFLTGAFFSAVLYPTVNYDSLTAHMPRVFFWLQNQSVAPHATPFGPQLFSGTFASYAVLNVQVLSNGADRLANLVQWVSYGFAIMTVSLIARELGGSRRGQSVAAIAAAATPMAALQASTSQNDLTTAVWCLAVAYCVVAYVTNPPSGKPATLGWVVWTGAALALAVQSKASTYVVCLPFLIWLCVVAIRRDGLRAAAVRALGVALVVLALTGSWYARNAVLLDGDVIGSSAPGMTHILVKDRDPSSLATTALKNSSMLLGTPFESVNERIANVFRATISAYGGDLENPENQEGASGAYRLDPRIANHDVAPGPLIALLVTVSAVIILAFRRDAPPISRWYLLAAAAALFLVAGLITWNLFINRILLGPLLLLVPVAGIAFTLMERRRSRIGVVVLLGLLATAVAWAAFVMAFNSTNRLVPPSVLPASVQTRDLGYWNTSYQDLRFRVLTPELEEPFKLVAQAIDREGASKVGIHDRIAHFPNYPLLWLLRDREVRYVRNTLLANKIDSGDFEPDVIVEIIRAEDYPAVLDDSTPRGELLVEPQRLGDYAVLLLYRAP